MFYAEHKQLIAILVLSVDEDEEEIYDLLQCQFHDRNQYIYKYLRTVLSHLSCVCHQKHRHR